MTVKTIDVKGKAALAADRPLVDLEFKIHDCRPNDVCVDIHYCGMCHSDLHTIRNEWKGTAYPCVAGHEIAGIVTRVGEAVKHLKVGDRVCIGAVINSCRKCPECSAGTDQYCRYRTKTYNSPTEVVDQDGLPVGFHRTTGGYADTIVCDSDYVYLVPEDIPLEMAGPIMCAGVTTFSPLKLLGADRGGKRIGVIGLGGLGHMAVKFAVAWKNHVTVFSTSEAKRDYALKTLGAHHFVNTTKDEEVEDAFKSAMSSTSPQNEQPGEWLDGIIDTVSAKKKMETYLKFLKTDGILVDVGLPPVEEGHLAVPASMLVVRRIRVMGSSLASRAETLEMLEVCSKYQVLPDIEVQPLANVNEALDKVAKGFHGRIVLKIKN